MFSGEAKNRHGTTNKHHTGPKTQKLSQKLGKTNQGKNPYQSLCWTELSGLMDFPTLACLAPVLKDARPKLMDTWPTAERIHDSD